jgi:allantoicase
MINDCGAVTHVRLSIYPDGGVSRLRLFGTPSREGRLAAGLAWLNALTEREAAAAILDCCGCPEWAKQIAEARPYRDAQGLYQAAESAASALSREQWLVAFASHPRIGEKRTGAQSEQANRWSAREQATVHASGAAEELASANREYESRFGHTFIVCASGKSAGEILALLRERMKNNAAKEFEVACGEQQKIARLRLERLVQL